MDTNKKKLWWCSKSPRKKQKLREAKVKSCLNIQSMFEKNNKDNENTEQQSNLKSKQIKN